MAAKNRNSNEELVLSHKEVAEILTSRGYPTTAKVAWHLEKSALRKLAENKEIRQWAVDAGLPVIDDD